MPTHATIYTRRGCHLCEDAEGTLRQHGLTIEMVDIDGDQALQERYGLVIPVVMIDGVERFRGRIDPRLLARLLHR
jgi:glutaredoxin